MLALRIRSAATKTINVKDEIVSECGCVVARSKYSCVLLPFSARICVPSRLQIRAVENLPGEEMNHFGKFMPAVLLACILFLTCTSIAQDTANLPYMNPKLSPEER